MLLTEEEAKTKRCQESFGDRAVHAMTHAQVMVAVSGTAQTAFASPAYCIGSACMAWRWGQPSIETKPLADFLDPAPKVMADWTKEKLDTAYTKAVEQGWPGVGSERTSWFHGYPLTVSRVVKRLGFCGKAGPA